MKKKHLKSKQQFRGKNVVITGGSSGIGLETAACFGHRGSRLFLIGRNAERLADAERWLRREVAEDLDVHGFTADVGDPGSITAAIQTIGHEQGGIHTLINNAGGILCGRFAERSIAEHEERMRVNYGGMVYALHAAWPFLAAAENGHVGFVSSVAGYLGAIGYSGYAPSKFAIAGLAECIRMEAAEHGIGVTVTYPPDTQTPFLEYEREHTLPETRALSANAKVMSARAVAERFVRGIERGDFEVLCNLESRLIRLLKATAPRLFFTMLDREVEKARRSAPRPQLELVSNANNPTGM